MAPRAPACDHMNRATTRGRPLTIACLAALACLAAPFAHASAHTGIDVTGLQVSVAPIDTDDRPGVSFAGAGGSTSMSEATSGLPPADRTVAANSEAAFGEVCSELSSDPAAGGSAMLRGDVFGRGANVHASAYASSRGPDATGRGTVGLVNGVSAAAFTLAPGTRMTITATVQAFASVSGASPFEMADSGLSMTLADADGGGLQFARIDFDALALGLFGPYDDVETSVLSLVYENDTDAAISGLFSGYVASYAYAGDPTAVPEPGMAATMLAGLALVLAGAGVTRGRPPEPRRQ